RSTVARGSKLRRAEEKTYCHLNSRLALNRLWQFNRARFADLLLRAARESLDELLRDPQYLGARPGIISALHTWGRNLSVHPHAHCLVSAGGVDGNGCFVVLQGATLLPARVLMAVFRGKLRFLLKTAVDDGDLVVPTLTTAARLQSLLNWLGRVPWSVRIQERYTHGISVAGYLARYITGGPLSNRRIHSVTATEVAFWYRDHRDGEKKLMRLPPHEFLSRWFDHQRGGQWNAAPCFDGERHPLRYCHFG
ncbi:MAG: transposase, partial [Planctomycetota bacterium]